MVGRGHANEQYNSPMRFVKRSATVHVHLIELDSDRWRSWIAFRDALGSGERLRQRYGALKLELATRYAMDRASYAAGNAAFIQTACAASVYGKSDNPPIPPICGSEKERQAAEGNFEATCPTSQATSGSASARSVPCSC